MASSKELESIVQESEPMAATITLDAKAPGSGKPNITSEDEKFSFIMQGIREKPSNGNRNNFVHVVASDCNRFGLSESYTLHQLCQYAEKGFDEKEIRQTVKSAYQRTNEYATKEFKKHHNTEQSYRYKSTSHNTPMLSASELTALLNACELDYDNPPEKPPTALRMGGEVVSTLGNFIAIIGKAKSRKTFCLTSAAAAALGRESLNISGELPEGKKKVLYFDTEQGSYHVFKTFDRIKKQSSSRQNLRVFQLREQSTEIRLQMIEEAIKTNEGVGIIFIDGIRDLIRDINNQDEATMITDWLLKWTSKLKICIVIVLHQNKNDSNARGHIGTEIINKAETTISIEKDAQNKDISIVKAEYTRNKEFEPFAFTINEDGIPELCEMEGGARKTITPESYDIEKHKGMLTEIFRFNTKRKSTELNKLIANLSGKYYNHFGESKAREFKEWYVDNGYLNISDSGNRKSYTLTEKISENNEIANT